MATQRVGTDRRSKGKKAQEGMVSGVLTGAGLVEVVEGWSGRHKVKIVKLTDMGQRVAIKLREIISILQKDDESTVSFEPGETSRH